VNTYDYTEEGQIYRRTVTPEEELATLKEKNAALERTNRIMREALYATKVVLENIDKAKAAFKGLDPGFCSEMVGNALRVSSAAKDMDRALDALRKAKEF